MRKKKLIFSAGGTGGHLFPAQAAAKSLSEIAEILFVGGKLKSSPYFEREGFNFEEISVSPILMKRPWKTAYGLIKGFKESISILKRFKPDLIVGFGSYYTAPLLAAGSILSIPILLHEQNSLPGQVNRLFSRRAKTTAISFPETAHHLHGSSVLVDFPLRIPKREINREEGAAYFGINPDLPTLLIFGGSQGASVINNLIKNLIVTLPNNLQIIHFTGNKEQLVDINSKCEARGVRYVSKPFEHRMDLAFSISDLVIARSGAATVSELIEWELPAILIPYLKASENHQEENAKHFVSQAGGGLYFVEDKIELESVKKAIDDLLGLEGDNCRINMQKYKKQRNLKSFVELVSEYL